MTMAKKETIFPIFIFSSCWASKFVFETIINLKKTNMKKTFLFSAVLLFSAGSFAQTSVKSSEAVKHQTSVENNRSGSHVNASANASSTSAIHSDVISKSKNKSRAEIKKEKKALAAEKRAQAAEVSNKGQIISGIASGETASNKGEVISGIASEGRSISASTHSQTKANVAAGHNNLSNNTSLNSSAKVKHSRKQIKNEEKQTVEVAGDATVKTSKHVKKHVNKKAIQARKKINATSANVVEAAHAIRPKPVSIKTGAQARTNAGIKIR
jgi:hypothetical protein